MLQSMIAEHGSICSTDLTYQMSGHASTPKVNGVRNQSDSNMHVSRQIKSHLTLGSHWPIKYNLKLFSKPTRI